jgi:hypothetical protein
MLQVLLTFLERILCGSFWYQVFFMIFVVHLPFLLFFSPSCCPSPLSVVLLPFLFCFFPENMAYFLSKELSRDADGAGAEVCEPVLGRPAQGGGQPAGGRARGHSHTGRQHLIHRTTLSAGRIRYTGQACIAGQ